jgi:hypothetical protein
MDGVELDGDVGIEFGRPHHRRQPAQSPPGAPVTPTAVTAAPAAAGADGKIDARGWFGGCKARRFVEIRIADVEVLHRSPYFCRRHFDSVRAGGFDRGQSAADCAVPGNLAADGDHHRLLSRAPAPRRSPKPVAAPIEEQLSGIENLVYFSSSAASNGALTISATFEVGADVNKAVIDVNNRVAVALPRLPEEVRRNGVVAQKRSTDILFVVALSSVDPRYDTLYLSNYATVNILDELKRVPGVADAFIFGARDYSMRIWLRPGQDGAARHHDDRCSPMPFECRTTSTQQARSDRNRHPKDNRSSTPSLRAVG